MDWLWGPQGMPAKVCQCGQKCEKGVAVWGLHLDDFEPTLTTVWTSTKEGRQLSAFALGNKSSNVLRTHCLMNQGVTPGPPIKG